MANEIQIPGTNALLINVWNYVLSRHLKKERVTCCHVFNFFVQIKLLLIPNDGISWFICNYFNSLLLCLLVGEGICWRQSRVNGIETLHQVRRVLQRSITTSGSSSQMRIGLWF